MVSHCVALCHTIVTHCVTTMEVVCVCHCVRFYNDAVTDAVTVVVCRRVRLLQHRRVLGMSPMAHFATLLRLCEPPFGPGHVEHDAPAAPAEQDGGLAPRRVCECFPTTFRLRYAISTKIRGKRFSSAASRVAATRRARCAIYFS